MKASYLRIGYWTSTLLFVLPQTWSAFQLLSADPQMRETLQDLGYPSYVMGMLGSAMLLGALTILALGSWPTLKEWAYAGFTFEVLGAFISELAAGENWLSAGVLLLLLGMQICSYWAWKKSASAVHTTQPSTAPLDYYGPTGRWPYSGRDSMRIRGHA